MFLTWWYFSLILHLLYLFDLPQIGKPLVSRLEREWTTLTGNLTENSAGNIGGRALGTYNTEGSYSIDILQKGLKYASS